MKPATKPRVDVLAGRLLHVDTATKAFTDRRVRDLPELVRAGDLLVVNDAATIPASLRVEERELEVRLAAHGSGERRFRALLFGAGDHRTPTEDRPLPERVRPGERLRFGAELVASVTDVDAEQPRLIELELDVEPDALWPALYRYGRPIQYAYIDGSLELWDVQSRFAGRPWAFEAPSAGLPLSWQSLLELRWRGAEIAWITHAAGLSSTGSPELDARLPLPERYAIPRATVDAIGRTRERGGRVIAVGTTVVRALEAAALKGGGKLEPGEGVATVVIHEGFRPSIVRALFTGMHEPGTSHFALLRALAPAPLLERALEHAAERHYLAHEFGDSCFIS